MTNNVFAADVENTTRKQKSIIKCQMWKYILRFRALQSDVLPLSDRVN